MTDVQARRAVRRRPRRRARLPEERQAQAARLRVHEQPRLEREAQGRRHPRDRPRADAHAPRRAARRCSSAARRSSTPAASSTSAQLIRDGYIHLLFAGNALATHDIEQALYGTSLGVRLDSGDIVEAGHEHHLRAINRIRRLGGIRQAVEAGVLKSGIMYECVKHNVAFLLAGSIRDDGPLPEVITDVLVAQRADARADPRRHLLPDGRHDAALDRRRQPAAGLGEGRLRGHQPATVTKLTDRGTFQTVGLVTDVEPFFRALVADVELLAGTPAG